MFPLEENNDVELQLEDIFVKIEVEAILDAKSINLRIKKDILIEWRILGAEDATNDSHFQLLQANEISGPELVEGVNLAQDNYAKTFFDYFWPDMEWVGEQMDTFFLDPRAPEYMLPSDQVQQPEQGGPGLDSEVMCAHDDYGNQQTIYWSSTVLDAQVWESKGERPHSVS